VKKRRRSNRRGQRSQSPRRGAIALACLISGALAGGLAALALERLAPATEQSLAWGAWWRDIRVELPDVSARLREPRFHLKRVEFLGLQVLDAGDLKRRLGIAPGVPLIDIDPDAQCERLRKHPRVAECRAARIPPDRLIMALSEREPIAVVDASGLGIDATGARFALAQGESAGLPRVRGKPGPALEFVLAAQDAGLALASIESDRRGDLIFELRGRALRVRVRSDPAAALAAWERLLASGLLDSHSPREVDLRFQGTAVLRNLRDNKGGKRDDAS
jgi:hypothetical protein